MVNEKFNTMRIKFTLSIVLFPLELSQVLRIEELITSAGIPRFH